MTPRSRRGGIICHPTSFPGPDGIGDLGEAAFRFVEWLARGSMADWQVLPLGPVGPGNSPYASPSAFAGNDLLISIPWLVGDGLLESQSLHDAPADSSAHVNYDAVRARKMPLLRTAYRNFQRGAASHLRAGLAAYQAEQHVWLDNYALFMALKDTYGGSWNTWPQEIALRHPDALQEASQRLADDMGFYRFTQFLFDHQWAELHRYANQHNIEIIGDLPIFVAYDSADVWANQELFRLTPLGAPVDVAGVPPDAFTADGQFWGNPVYDWDAHAASGYAWWIARVQASFRRVDALRIDHFRAFAAGWVIPATARTAAEGHWEAGPGLAIFAAMRKALGPLQFIVEDLGIITSDVVALREALGFPGMKVLQFAFDSGPYNAYLPHNYEPNSVVYTGTHDNQTSIGWFKSLREDTRASVQRYLARDGSDIAWDLIRAAWSSVAERALAPLQDVMRLDDDARMNTPGSPVGNWTWRYAPHQLHEGLADSLRETTDTYGRSHAPLTQRGYDPYDYTAPATAHPLLARPGTNV